MTPNDRRKVAALIIRDIGTENEWRLPESLVLAGHRRKFVIELTEVVAYSDKICC